MNSLCVRALITRLLLATAMIVSVTIIRANFAGGSGTEADPWQIATAEHLNNVRNYLGPEHRDKYFIQTADINLGITPHIEGEGWEPIGMTEVQLKYDHIDWESFDPRGRLSIAPRIYYPSTNSFYGNYDGRNYSITHLTIITVNDFQGLFGHTVSAVLQNIHFDAVSIKGNNSIGALIGRTDSLTVINNCSVSGTVEGVRIIGGLIGNLVASSVTGSHSNANVNGSNTQIGGLIGYVENGTVTNCYSNGIVRGPWYVGGLIGESTHERTSNKKSVVERSFSSGFVIGLLSSHTIGGLIGTVRYTDLKDCYSATSVITYTTMAGCLVGSIANSSMTNCYAVGDGHHIDRRRWGLSTREPSFTVINSYWNTETTGNENPLFGTTKNTAQMVQRATYEGWDFDTVWQIEDGYSYPYLIWQETPWQHNTPGPNNLQARNGNGAVKLTWDKPLSDDVIGYKLYRNHQPINNDKLISSIFYEDRDVNNFETYYYYVTAVLKNSIETGWSNRITGNPYTMAGGSGTADDPYVIKNAYQLDAVRLNKSSHFRLESNIDLGVAPWNEGEGWKPIGSTRIPFSGSFNGNGHIISNMTINSFLQYKGLFSSLTNAEITNLGLDNVQIHNGSTNGGVAGIINNSIISRCYVSGSLSGNSQIGGIAGEVRSSSIIRDCYNAADLKASEWAGWVGGIFSGGFRVTIENCYSIGSIEVRSQTRSGGIAGVLHNVDLHSNIINCYWDIDRTGLSKSADNVEGHSTSQMLTRDFFEGWDFENVWSIGYDGKNTYPWLRYQGKPAGHNYPQSPE